MLSQDFHNIFPVFGFAEAVRDLSLCLSSACDCHSFHAPYIDGYFIVSHWLCVVSSDSSLMPSLVNEFSCAYWPLAFHLSSNIFKLLSIFYIYLLNLDSQIGLETHVHFSLSVCPHLSWDPIWLEPVQVLQVLPQSLFICHQSCWVCFLGVISTSGSCNFSASPSHRSLSLEEG